MKKFNEKKAGLLSFAELKTARGKIIYWTMFAVMIIVALCSVLPAIWAVFTAFKTSQEIYTSTSFFPKDITLQKALQRISEAWKQLELGSTIFNTLVRSVGDVAFRILVCGFGGYVLSKIKPVGAKVIFTLVVWTMMMPSQIRTVPCYIGYLNFPFAWDYNGGMGVSLLDTYWPFWLGAGADCFAIMLFKNNFDTLSTSYTEAAKIDGCTNYGIFFKIMLPLSTPIIIYEAINALSIAWSDFFGPLLILNKNATMPLKIFKMKAETSVRMNTYFMGLIFASIPPFVIFALFQKRIMGGLTVGGVKG